MNVDGIKKGIVLDHIKAGRGMDIYRLLHLEKMKCSVAIVQNARSTKYGRKDIIKIDEMITLDMDMLGYIDPNITINIVENGKLYEKKNLELPEKLTNVIRCHNPRCITSTEQEIKHTFLLADRENRIYRCIYCDVAHKEQMMYY